MEGQETVAISTFIHDKAHGSPLPGWPDVVGRHEVTYEGKVLATRERNFHDDSDFYALVWDDETGTIKEVEYATTRGWTYANGASVDATPDVIDKANAYARRLFLSDLKDRAVAAARKVAKGKRVKVVNGRKVAKGTEGTVFWVGPGRAYSYYAAKYGVPDRVGFKTDDGVTHWTAASNLEVTDAEDWLADLSDLEARAASADWSYVLARGAAARGLVLM